ncbi:xylulokinase [Robinsoniella peoriensis]|uniref:xylulokinase n=1 Tax=Robinsoniella peoriensis TaxID=180332 RepID=UPI00085CD36F|nr:FGGY family carbohydrate kinase [Robinsoniella peoriensis]
MKDILLMAVDLGTSFIKVGVYDTDSTCITLETEPVKDYRPGPGIFIQKGEELLASVITCMKKVCAALEGRAECIEAIAFTGQMSGFMGVDKNWNDITTWSCSLDSRYMPYAEKQMEKLRDPFLCIGGTNFPQMAPKYEWFKMEYPEQSKKIAKYLMISGYVIGKLGDISVEDAVIDRSFTQWTGLADVQNDRWSQEICREIGLDEKYLPRIVNSNHICARLNKEMAAATGLKQGVVLVSGAGDKPAGCLGAGIVNYGDMIFEASSYGEVSCCVSEYRPDMDERRLDVIPSAVPGEFYATHFAAGSGITLDWFMNTFVKQAGISTKEMFVDMEHKMSSIAPGCNGLMGIGLLGGSSMPLDGSLRGMWMGFDWSHSKEHFYKALLESFTYDFTLCMQRMEELYPEYELDHVRIIGGGAKSPVWTQMCADVQGKRYEVLNREDAAMWGAAILAGNAIGVFPDLKETALKHVKVEREFLPDLTKREAYMPYLHLYKDYMVELHDFYERIGQLSNNMV